MCEIHATSLAPPLAKVQSFFNPAFARRNHPPPDESAVGGTPILSEALRGWYCCQGAAENEVGFLNHTILGCGDRF
jgi:hypothetical protein